MTRPDLRENDCGEDGCGEGDCGEDECGEDECGENDCGEDDCGEDECGEEDCGEEDDYGEEMPEPQTTSQSPSFCSCCQSSQVSFLLSGATSSNSNSLRRFLDVSKLAVECMKGW